MSGKTGNLDNTWYHDTDLSPQPLVCTNIPIVTGRTLLYSYHPRPQCIDTNWAPLHTLTGWLGMFLSFLKWNEMWWSLICLVVRNVGSVRTWRQRGDDSLDVRLAASGCFYCLVRVVVVWGEEEGTHTGPLSRLTGWLWVCCNVLHCNTNSYQL